MKQDFVRRAKERQLQNIHFIPLQPPNELTEQPCAADVLLLTQKAAVKEIVFPSKIMTYMSVGRPIIASVSAESDAGRFIADHGVGVVCTPEDSESLASAILSMAEEGNGQEQGKRGRDTAERLFDSRVVLPRFAGYLESTAIRTSPVTNKG